MHYLHARYLLNLIEGQTPVLGLYTDFTWGENAYVSHMRRSDPTGRAPRPVVPSEAEFISLVIYVVQVPIIHLHFM